MKKTLTFLLLLALLVGACSGSETPVVESSKEEAPATITSEPELTAPEQAIEISTTEEAEPEETKSGPLLTITDGTTEVTYNLEELEALAASEASFGDIAYIGVPLHILLGDAGFDAEALRAVKVVAVDGFSANYEPAQFLAEDTLVAYARVDGELADDEKPFRMVVPEGGGGLNVRLLSRVEVIP